MKASLLAVVLAVGCAGAPRDRVRVDDIVAERPHEPQSVEPAADFGGDNVWLDAAWMMSVYQLRKPLMASREAANVNALDEVDDSTWFTNRHALRRLSPAELAEGPNGAHAPATRGPLVVLSAKPHGMTPGIVVRDAKGDRYMLKFDPPDHPEVPTGAEMVGTKIVHALGWNVPENYLVRIDAERLVLDADTRSFDASDLRHLLAHAGRDADGRLRAVASRWLPGTAKGGFRTLGTRADDPDDVVPHQHRRELRGFRVVAAWINYTDARRGNFLDTFVPAATPDGRGRLVHYVLDFSSALGAANDGWKPPRLGHEYFLDPRYFLLRGVTLGFVRPAWADVPLVHPALGYFDAEHFDPVAWRTTYPNPLFDAATIRDTFWGAKLVSTFTDADLTVVAGAGDWSDPRTTFVLADVLRGRQRAIARAYFDWRQINPIDGIAVDDRARLRFRDLAVDHGVVPAERARYRRRIAEGAWDETMLTAPLPAMAAGPLVIELATSHDRGGHWSPSTRVTIARSERGRMVVSAIRRATR
jgi:hypothetical protein